MNAKPIPFNEAMSCALLHGRKTQTRRVAKLTAAGHVKEPGGHSRWHPGDPDAVLACPYGQPGDLLWVRQPWRTHRDFDGHTPAQFAALDHFPFGPPMLYLGSGMCYSWPRGANPMQDAGRYRHARFMPRALSRLTLRITEVRLQRVQEISEEDAEAEGIEGRNLATGGDDFQDLWRDYSKPDRPENFPWFEGDQRASFRSLWDSLNADRGFGWDANPWVWAVSFEVINQNVDDVLREAA